MLRARDCSGEKFAYLSSMAHECDVELFSCLGHGQGQQVIGGHGGHQSGTYQGECSIKGSFDNSPNKHIFASSIVNDDPVRNLHAGANANAQ